MTTEPTKPELLSPEALAEIERGPWVHSYGDDRLEAPLKSRRVAITVGQRDALCQTVRAAWAERDRALTPSIVESLRLLDGAGYGKEVPNSMSEMIRKVLVENTALREQLAHLQGKPHGFASKR